MTDTIHHLPGRLRLRLAALKRNPPVASRVRGALASLPGITGIRLGLLTGSALILYDPRQISAGQVIAALAAADFAIPSTPAPAFGEALGRALVALAVDVLMERSTVALIAALV